MRRPSGNSFPVILSGGFSRGMAIWEEFIAEVPLLNTVDITFLCRGDIVTCFENGTHVRMRLLEGCLSVEEPMMFLLWLWSICVDDSLFIPKVWCMCADDAMDILYMVLYLYVNFMRIVQYGDSVQVRI